MSDFSTNFDNGRRNASNFSANFDLGRHNVSKDEIEKAKSVGLNSDDLDHAVHLGLSPADIDAALEKRVKMKEAVLKALSGDGPDIKDPVTSKVN